MQHPISFWLSIEVCNTCSDAPAKFGIAPSTRYHCAKATQSHGWFEIWIARVAVSNFLGSRARRAFMEKGQMQTIEVRFAGWTFHIALLAVHMYPMHLMGYV